MLAAAIFGVSMVFVNRRWVGRKWAVFIPSGSTLGLALILNPSESLTLFLGTLVAAIWERRNKASAQGVSLRVDCVEST